MAMYEIFLKTDCKINFEFYVFQDSNRLNWRYLRGPEKYRLFAKVNLVTLFPSIPNIGDIQEIWADFFKLNASIRSFHHHVK